MTPAKARIAGIYTRISVDKSGRALGVAEQELKCRQLCEDRGWKVFGTVFSDNDISASRQSKKLRPGYTAMMAALAAGDINAIVATNPDRIYRRLADLVLFTAAVQSVRATVATVTGGDIELNTADGIASAGYIGVAAQHASDRASERQKDKQAIMARDGLPHGHAYGVTKPKDSTRDLDHEVAVIREVAQNIIEGSTVRQQCLMLNRRGDLTVRGNRWLPTNLKRMLASPGVVGERTYLGVITKAQWPSIITRAQQATITAKFTHVSPRGRPAKHLLSGILRCGVCGTKMQWNPSWAKSKNRAQYVCPSAPQGNSCLSIPALATEQAIIDRVLAYSDTRPQVVQWHNDGGLADSIAADLTTLDELDAALLAGDTTPRAHGKMSQAIETRIDENRAKLAGQAPTGDNPDATYWLALRPLWEEVGEDVEWRREQILAVVDHIDVGKARAKGVAEDGRLTPVWRQ
jgi:site-specific DNA recombinase